MTLEQVGALLKMLAAYDGRNVGEADVIVWARQMDGLDFDDALEAVHQHYAETNEWAKPSHIRTLADRRRNARNRRPDVPAPGCYEPDPAERRRLVLDEGPRALPGRYETDAERDARKQANLKALRRIAELAAQKFSMDREAQKAANAAALEDALSATHDPGTASSQFEAVRRAAERERGMRGPDRGAVVIQGPWWLDGDKREEHATALLAGLGRLHIDASASSQQSDETA